MTPDQEKKLDDLHLAVCGNEDLGVDGIVNDVRDLKRFRRGLELKVAGISGGVCTILFAVKLIFFNH